LCLMPIRLAFALANWLKFYNPNAFASTLF
jgi:hypothetical protein